jgi:hypothetical protein
VSASSAPGTARVARRLDLLQARDLRLAHGGVVDLARVDLGLLGQLELVHADDDVLAAVDARLAAAAVSSILSFGQPLSIAFVMPPISRPRR